MSDWNIIEFSTIQMKTNQLDLEKKSKYRLGYIQGLYCIVLLLGYILYLFIFNLIIFI